MSGFKWTELQDGNKRKEPCRVAPTAELSIFRCLLCVALRLHRSYRLLRPGSPGRPRRLIQLLSSVSILSSITFHAAVCHCAQLQKGAFTTLFFVWPRHSSPSCSQITGEWTNGRGNIFAGNATILLWLGERFPSYGGMKFSLHALLTDLRLFLFWCSVRGDKNRQALVQPLQLVILFSCQT